MSTPSLASIARALRRGEIRSVDLVRGAAEARAASTDPVGPYKTWDASLAKEQGRLADQAFAAGIDAGPLQGIPVSIKDLFGVAGWPTFAGTDAPLPPEWQAEGPVVRALRAQLVVVMGKTHTVELAFGGLGTNPHWGTPRNPWDDTTHRVPGGSSAGAGVSLIEGSALLALGTDTAGSVRIPASMTGTVGLKTSFGRWPTEGIVPLSPSLDSVGLLARTAEDVAFAFEAIERRLHGSGALRVERRPLRSCRFGVPRGFFYDGASTGIEGALGLAVAVLERAGASVVPVELGEATEAYELFLRGGLAGVELAAFLSDSLPELVDRLDPAVRDRVRASEAMTAVEYLHRRSRLASLAASASVRLREVDAMITPTVAVSPPALSELRDLDGYRRINLLALRNTSIGNLLGLCAISIPAGRDALGLPVGMQLLAPAGRDGRLLGLAIEAELALGGRD